MSKKNLALGLIVFGMLLLIVSVIAEPLGLGRNNGFGSRQLVGTIVGASMVLIGLLKGAKTPATV